MITTDTKQINHFICNRNQYQNTPSYQLNVSVFLTIVELGNERKSEAATELSSRTWRQPGEQRVVSGTRPHQVPQNLTSHNCVAPRHKHSQTVISADWQNIARHQTYACTERVCDCTL